MDPNATLREIRACIDAINEVNDDCSEDGESTPDQQAELVNLATELAGFAEALDGWICKGGFLPSDWARTAPR